MATIEGSYQQLRSATNVQAVYYMDPAEGRTGTFDIFGVLAGGLVFKVQGEAMPEGFQQDFPNALKVDYFEA